MEIIKLEQKEIRFILVEKEKKIVIKEIYQIILGIFKVFIHMLWNDSSISYYKIIKDYFINHQYFFFVKVYFIFFKVYFIFPQAHFTFAKVDFTFAKVDFTFAKVDFIFVKFNSTILFSKYKWMNDDLIIIKLKYHLQILQHLDDSLDL